MVLLSLRNLVSKSESNVIMYFSNPRHKKIFYIYSIVQHMSALININLFSHFF